MNNITFKDMFLLFLFVIATIASLSLIFSVSDTKKKKALIKSVPNKDGNLLDKLMNIPFIKKFFIDITTANGNSNDSPEELFKHFIKSCILGVCCLLIAIIAKYTWVGVVFMFVVISYPFWGRVLDKKSFKKNYINDFYIFLNYITLYLSGGVNMKQSLIEVNKLIDEKSVLKEKLEEVVSKNAISGFTGDSYISTLEELNRGLNFSEINTFIATAKRSQDRGDALADILLYQMDDITKKVEFQKRSYITSQESVFTILQVTLGMLPDFIIYAVPIFISAIMTLTVL